MLAFSPALQFAVKTFFLAPNLFLHQASSGTITTSSKANSSNAVKIHLGICPNYMPSQWLQGYITFLPLLHL